MGLSYDSLVCVRLFLPFFRLHRWFDAIRPSLFLPFFLSLALFRWFCLQTTVSHAAAVRPFDCSVRSFARQNKQTPIWIFTALLAVDVLWASRHPNPSFVCPFVIIVCKMIVPACLRV